MSLQLYNTLIVTMARPLEIDNNDRADASRIRLQYNQRSLRWYTEPKTGLPRNSLVFPDQQTFQKSPERLDSSL